MTQQLREWDQTGLTVPAHVPDNAIRDFDFYFLDSRDKHEEFDVFQAYKHLQDGPDVFYTPRNGGHWVLTRYDDMQAVYADAEHFNSRVNTIPPVPHSGFGFLNYDGSRHTAFRNLLQPYFSPKVVAQFEPTIKAVAATLIQEFSARGECEFMMDFAKKMPTMIVMKFILQLPEEDTPYLMRFVDDVAHAGHDMTAFMQAFAKLWEYVATQIIPQRRANPGDDVLSAIIHSKPEGAPIKEEEILGAASVLIVGGLDTMVGALGFAALHLAKNPQHRRALIENPALIPAAADELLRRYAIVNHARTVIKDFEFKGHKFAAGDLVLLPTSASAVDETHFKDAMAVDFGRPNNKKNLTFAYGPHYCLGTFVARSEMVIFLSEWLKHIPDFEIKPGAAIKVTTGITNHIESLPLVWQA